MIVTAAIDIESAPSDIWRVLNDPDTLKRVMKGILENVPTSEGPTRVGSTFRMKIKEGRQVSDYDGEILVYEPDEHMRVRLVGGCMKEPMRMTVDYVIVPIGPRLTRLDYSCNGEACGVWKYIAPLCKPLVRMQVRGFLKGLKRLAETDTAAPIPA
ncbi:MAG: SRPBCC family protein [Planctomycetota bacterium]|jgi:carbon monoxide dehydrogenase subunit G